MNAEDMRLLQTNYMHLTQLHPRDLRVNSSVFRVGQPNFAPFPGVLLRILKPLPAEQSVPRAICGVIILTLLQLPF